MSWEAQITMSRADDGLIHVYAPVRGSSLEQAQEGASFILQSLAIGKQTYIREMPSASEDKDFDTKITKYRGFVRFSFFDRPGKWEKPQRWETVSFGELA